MNNNKRKRKIDDFRKDVQRSIRQLRRDRGWSQAELGRRIGVDQATISNWESDKTDIPLTKMFEIVLVAGLDCAKQYFSFMSDNSDTQPAEKEPTKKD
ncbi:helix-turn-helix transcriptional regulator [Pseudoalteromonas rubra]|uniref:HTH cro/C1-type domain-containing protein n=1 Tax=Pseudoalteromonas rubra TaxID=43658 RepID=A0A0U3HZJ0_9GAMM|nr:helix-turn-helix transcriptional regulator [Pseudoalteromonas rubra]ALU43078.1 hypothetical protein AT705_09050 [Pseudoalteromonas rubra]